MVLLNSGNHPHGWADFSSHVWLTWPNQETQETSAGRFQPHSTASAETKPSKLFMTLLDYSKDDSLDTHGIPTICGSGWVRYSFLESFRHSYIILYQNPTTCGFHDLINQLVLCIYYIYSIVLKNKWCWICARFHGDFRHWNGESYTSHWRVFGPMIHPICI